MSLVIYYWPMKKSGGKEPPGVHRLYDAGDTCRWTFVKPKDWYIISSQFVFVLKVKIWVNNPMVWDFCVLMIGRTDMEGSNSDVAMNAWLPQVRLTSQNNPKPPHVLYWRVNNPTLWDFCVSMIADIERSNSNVAINACLPQASYPCGNFSHTSTRTCTNPC